MKLHPKQWKTRFVPENIPRITETLQQLITLVFSFVFVFGSFVKAESSGNVKSVKDVSIFP